MRIEVSERFEGLCLFRSHELTGEQRDGVRIDTAKLHRGGDGLVDHHRVEGAMEHQNVRHVPSSVRWRRTHLERRPQRIVHGGPLTALTRLTKRRGASKCTGFVLEHIKVVVQDQPLFPLSMKPGMKRDDLTFMADFEASSGQAGFDLTSDIPNRYRVGVACDANPTFSADARCRDPRRIEGLRKSQECWMFLVPRSFYGASRSDRYPKIVPRTGVTHCGIKFLKPLKRGNGCQMVTPKPSTSSFHTTLFVSADKTWPTEDGLKQVMRAHRHESVGFQAPAPLEDFPHRSGEIVVANSREHTSEPLKR